jgi:hydroxymethylbilane synthase
VKPIVIGTRGSALARWQAEHVAARLRSACPGLEVSLRIIKTRGDKILDVPLARVGGKGLFVKEIEEALVRGEVDLAVHSVKDVPAELGEGLVLAAIPEREDPRDALVLPARGGVPARGGLGALARGAVVGTSSLRRRCQLAALRPDLAVRDLRGNVDTRLRKLDAGEFDAVLLAAAGLIRLGFGDRVSELLDPAAMLPAAGQGALGIEARGDDREALSLAASLHHAETASRVRAERALLARLGGGGQVPIAAHARLEGTGLLLEALVGHPTSGRILRGRAEGDRARAEEIGRDLGADLLARGGGEILDEILAADERGEKLGMK